MQYNFDMPKLQPFTPCKPVHEQPATFAREMGDYSTSIANREALQALNSTMLGFLAIAEAGIDCSRVYQNEATAIHLNDLQYTWRDILHIPAVIRSSQHAVVIGGELIRLTDQDEPSTICAHTTELGYMPSKTPIIVENRSIPRAVNFVPALISDYTTTIRLGIGDDVVDQKTRLYTPLADCSITPLQLT